MLFFIPGFQNLNVPTRMSFCIYPATGEWTKAVSKKDRKHRSKKDDGSRKDDFPSSAAAEKTSPSHEILKTVQVTHPTAHSRDEVCSNRTQRRVGFTFSAVV